MWLLTSKLLPDWRKRNNYCQLLSRKLRSTVLLPMVGNVVDLHGSGKALGRIRSFFKCLQLGLYPIVFSDRSTYYCFFSTLFLVESSDILSPLVDILLKLFRKMIDVHLPFHLTLLSVCFSNLKDLPRGKKGSIGFYLKQMSPPAGSGKRARVS